MGNLEQRSSTAERYDIQFSSIHTFSKSIPSSDEYRGVEEDALNHIPTHVMEVLVYKFE